jgi:hypothetical protein
LRCGPHPVLVALAHLASGSVFDAHESDHVAEASVWMFSRPESAGTLPALKLGHSWTRRRSSIPPDRIRAVRLAPLRPAASDGSPSSSLLSASALVWRGVHVEFRRGSDFLVVVWEIHCRCEPLPNRRRWERISLSSGWGRICPLLPMLVSSGSPRMARWSLSISSVVLAASASIANSDSVRAYRARTRSHSLRPGAHSPTVALGESVRHAGENAVVKAA